MRATRMGQLSSQGAVYMAQSSPAAKALLRGAAAAKEPGNSLNKLYEVVRAQQPHEGCPLSAQQVELICSVIGEQQEQNTTQLAGCVAGLHVVFIMDTLCNPLCCCCCCYREHQA